MSTTPAITTAFEREYAAFIEAYPTYAETDAHARFERKLYVIRNRVTHAADSLGLSQRNLFYVASLSSNTIVYKGMLIADQMETMFPDLSDQARLTDAMTAWWRGPAGRRGGAAFPGIGPRYIR